MGEGDPTARSGDHSLGARALLGGAVVAGWVFFDLASFTWRGEPRLALELLAGSLAAILGGFILGGLWARVRWLPWLLGAAGALFAVTRVTGWRPFRLSYFVLGEAIFLLAAAAILAGFLARRRWLPPAGGGFAAGLVAAAALRFARLAVDPSAVVLVAVAVLFAAAGLIPRRGLRTAGLAVAGCAALAYLGAVGWDTRQLRRADLAPSEAPAAAGPNLLMISLDTVRAHRMALYGHDRETTPRLDRLAREESVLYEQARSTSSWTLPSHASIFTGLSPARHGAHHPRDLAETNAGPGHWPARGLRPELRTLAGILRERGWQTAAVVSNSNYLAHEYGVDRGFGHYDDRRAVSRDLRRLALVQLAGWRPEVGQRSYREAGRITDLALARLDRAAGGERPFFLFLNYMDAHSPYLPPAPYDRAFGEEGPVDPLNPPRRWYPLLYDRELLYLDTEVGRLLDGMRARGLLEETVLIVLSDHGEAFGEHGFYGHDKTLYEEVLRVPQLIRHPGGRGAGEAVSEPVTGREVFALALEAVGLPASDQEASAPMEARDQAPTPGGPVPIAEWFRSPMLAAEEDTPSIDRDLIAWLEGRRKIIVSSRGDVEVYDLAVDPDETKDLSGALPEQAWIERAARWWQENPPMGHSPQEAMDDEALEQLESLGYID